MKDAPVRHRVNKNYLSGFHVKTDWPAGDATGFEGLITVPIRKVLQNLKLPFKGTCIIISRFCFLYNKITYLSGGNLCNWTVQVTFNTGVYDFELWGQDAHMVSQVRALLIGSVSFFNVQRYVS